MSAPTARPPIAAATHFKRFAYLTGGRLYPNETIEKAVAEAVRDSAASYVLTYAPKSDAGFHPLRSPAPGPARASKHARATSPTAYAAVLRGATDCHLNT